MLSLGRILFKHGQWSWIFSWPFVFSSVLSNQNNSQKYLFTVQLVCTSRIVRSHVLLAMEQSNQRTYKLASVGEYLTFPDVEKHVLTVWGFDFMLSCFHQNFWRLKKEELLQFAKCSTFRCSLRSLQNQNLRQSFSDGNISFVINQSNKSKPIEQLSLNWSIYYFIF